MVAAGALMKPLQKVKHHHQDTHQQLAKHDDSDARLQHLRHQQDVNHSPEHDTDAGSQLTPNDDGDSDDANDFYDKIFISSDDEAEVGNKYHSDIVTYKEVQSCEATQLDSEFEKDSDAFAMQDSETNLATYKELQSYDPIISEKHMGKPTVNKIPKSASKYRSIEMEQQGPSDQDNNTNGICSCRNCYTTTFTSVGFQILLKEKHLLLCYTGFLLWGIVYSGWTLFLVSYGVSKNLTSANAALLSSLGGLGTLIGRLAHGPFIDHNIMTGAQMYSLLSFFGAATLFSYAFVSGFAGLGVLSAIVGLCIGTRSILGIVVIKENVDDINFKAATGWSYFFQGVGTVIGSPLTGI